MLSPALRRRVWNAYRPGQEADKEPSREWWEAAQAAIRYVAESEGGAL